MTTFFVTEYPTNAVTIISIKLCFFILGIVSKKDIVANIISIKRLESIYYTLRKYI